MFYYIDIVDNFHNNSARPTPAINPLEVNVHYSGINCPRLSPASGSEWSGRPKEEPKKPTTPPKPQKPK